MKLKLLIPFFLVSLSFFCSCDDDNDSWSEDYKMDFLDMITDSKGQTFQAINDDGETLKVDNPITGLKADTTYRYIAVYIRNGSAIQLSNYGRAISSKPVVFAGTDKVYTDPVRIQSLWKVDNYINATLQIQNKTEQHIMGFIDQGITTNSEGKRIAHVQLFHNKNNDATAFTSTVYASLPLRVYSDTLTKGQDSIYFTVNTEDGLQLWQYLY